MVSTLLTHLCNCELQSPQIKQWAADQKKLNVSPSCRTVVGVCTLIPSLSHSLNSPPLPSPIFRENFVSSPSCPATPPFSYLSLQQLSSADSIHPSSSASVVSALTSSGYSVPSVAHQTLLSRSRGPSGGIEIPFWNDMKKWEFEQLLVHLMASAGLLFSWVENPEWILVCEEFLLGAPQTSQKVLTQQILHDMAAELWAEIQRSIKGKEVTLQGDGWTGLNHHHLIAFMITTIER